MSKPIKYRKWWFLQPLIMPVSRKTTRRSFGIKKGRYHSKTGTCYSSQRHSGFFQQQFSHGWLETDMIDALLATIANKYMLYCKMGVTVACCPESMFYVEHPILPYKKEFYQSNFLVCALPQIRNLKQDDHTITLLLYLCIVASNPKPQWKWIRGWII